MNSKIQYRLIDDPEILAKMRPSWDRLLQQTNNDNIYITWEWLSHWWQVYHEGRSLFIVIAERDNELVGLLPLLRRKITYYRCFKFRRIEFLSTGETEEEEVCPTIMNCSILPGLEQQVCEGFIHFLVDELGDEWDELRMTPLVMDDLKTKHFSRCFATQRNYLCRTEEQGINAYTDLSNGWDELSKSFGRKTRKGLRRGRKFIAETQDSGYRFLENTEDFDYFYDAFVELHSKRWNNSSIFDNSNFARFQRQVCKDIFEKGWLMLSLLTIDNKIISGNLDYCHGDTVYGYLTAYDPDFKTKLSLGLLGMSYCLEHSSNNTYKKYDWYRVTDKGNYKKHFSPNIRYMVTFNCQKQTLNSILYTGARKIVLALKRLRRQQLKRFSLGND
ncbi:GNAT family N-acetyltransferase [Thalassotalea fonticola]|uniref:GNAT family N-acetyltransferase n=1 Tax=Thalassotalea fonticola TaxID=3065649 RepID=A0ABZ0GMJ1_9GAMM|nr:GNAT family N-acetyltransferase [Colwelliaceae bacterium S1-1]